MKTILFMIFLFLSSGFLNAQGVVILKNGEIISAKVAEVGINEIKYYKTSNLQDPVYVASKADVAQINYSNGTKDVFQV